MGADKIGRVSIKAAPKTDSRLAARCAALASLGAAAIHFGVVPAHWQEWALAGAFFAALAGFQLVWAVLILVRTTTPVLAAGIALNVGAVALWVVSRTDGAPFGPHAGEPELVQTADLCALLLQIYVVMGACWIWYRGLQGEPVSAFVSGTVLVGAIGVIALASTVGFAAGQRHGHHGPAEADAAHHGPAEVDTAHHGAHVGDTGGHPAQPAVPLGNGPAQAPAAQPPADAAVATVEPPHELHSDHGDHHE